MAHALTLEQIKDLQERGYKVTFHVGDKLGARVQYFKIEAKTISIKDVPKIFLPTELSEVDKFLPTIKQTILN